MQLPIYLLLLLYDTINLTSCSGLGRRVSKREHEELEGQHRKAICCAKKMRCCVKPDPPPIEIRAILARCPNVGPEGKGPHLTRNLHKSLLSATETNIKSFQGFDEDEPLIQSRVVACRRKVLMTLKMHHKGEISCKHQYIVVDHVYDPLSERSVRLLNPYVIKLRQQPVSKSYFLKFMDYVNSEAYEQIYNKHDSNYTGCYTEKGRSTCGIVKYDNLVIPYSGGFCCSCDAKKNAERQPESINEKNEAIISYSDPAYLLDHVECPRNYYKEAIDEEHVVPSTTEEPIQQQYNHALAQNTQCSAKNITQPCEKSPVITSESTPTAKKATEFPPPDKDENMGKRSTECNLFKSTTQAGGHTRWKYTTYSCTRKKDDSLKHKYLTAPAGSLKAKRNDENTRPEFYEYLKNLQLNKNKRRNIMKDDKKVEFPDHVQLYVDHLIENLGDNIFTQRLIRKMRQTFPSGGQVRGNQNCASRYTPPGLDPEHYHESAHCLRFSEVWYGIYKLGEPFVEQTVFLNIYERFESETNPERWREITNGTVLLGNRNPSFEDELPTVSIQFSAKTLTDDEAEKYSKLHHKRILIPEGVRECDVHKYAEMRNGPEEYLVVSPKQIAIEGDQCDKIGVGFEAFAKQPTRCSVPKGTCLHNQPKHLWMHDKRMEKRNLKGCYFLKYHANITSDPIVTNGTSGDKYLDVEYNGAHITNLDIEIKADFNAVIRLQTTAVITEVYVDSTCDKLTILTVKVINSGLISSKYMVQLTDFPLDISSTFGRIKSRLATIAPQNQHVFTLEIRDVLPSDLMYCSIEVLNYNKELVALRRVRIQKFDRCICTWHCLCACVASSEGLKCNPMSLEHYHAAGFQGSLPIVTYMVHFTLLDDLISLVFYFAMFLIFLLLLLGLSKGLLGMCWYSIGVWGLPVIIDLPRKISKYYEPSLKQYDVIYDEQGYPIHPIKKTRVRDISRVTLFCTNLVFFLTYPLACCVIILRRLCCPYYAKVPRKKLHPKTCHDKGIDCNAPQISPASSYNNVKDTQNEIPQSSRQPNVYISPQISAYNIQPMHISKKRKEQKVQRMYPPQIQSTSDTKERHPEKKTSIKEPPPHEHSSLYKRFHKTHSMRSILKNKSLTSTGTSAFTTQLEKSTQSEPSKSSRNMCKLLKKISKGHCKKPSNIITRKHRDSLKVIRQSKQKEEILSQQEPSVMFSRDPEFWDQMTSTYTVHKPSKKEPVRVVSKSHRHSTADDSGETTETSPTSSIPSTSGSIVTLQKRGKHHNKPGKKPTQPHKPQTKDSRMKKFFTKDSQGSSIATGDVSLTTTSITESVQVDPTTVPLTQTEPKVSASRPKSM